MIELQHLTKKFGNEIAVDEIELSIPRGTFFGLLGPNGAGKTTTLRMLTTLVKPTTGQILIEGKDMTRDEGELKGKIGLVAQHTSLENEMTAWENIELHGRLHRMEKTQRRERIEELMRFVDLWNHKDKLIKQLSGGMKRKLMIARALMHKPSILFMDEPTVGLDPVSRRSIWDLLKNLNQKGLTVFMTTHYIEEAEMLCDLVALMDRGKIIAQGSPDSLKEQVGKFILELFEQGKSTYKFFDDRSAGLDYAEQMGGKVTIRESNLEDVFIKLTDRRVGE